MLCSEDAKTVDTYKGAFSRRSRGQYQILITLHMVEYLRLSNEKPVVVFLNGSTDMKHLNTLKLHYNITILLDMKTKENRRNRIYELVLKDMNEGKRVIFTINVYRGI